MRIKKNVNNAYKIIDTVLKEVVKFFFFSNIILGYSVPLREEK